MCRDVKIHQYLFENPNSNFLRMNRIFSPSLFAGKVNIVTGGGTGIGFGVARAIVELGGKCVIASRSGDKINAAVDQLKEHCTGDADVTGLTVNVRDRDSVRAMIKDTLEIHGRLDGLVNNGGGQFYSNAEQISSKGWNAVIETNFYGTWNCMQEAFDQYMKDNGGYIVNIVTTNRTGMPGMSHSGKESMDSTVQQDINLGAARAGVKSLSQSMGGEWGQYGVMINNIAPGVVYSDSAIANYGPLGEKETKLSK